MARKPVTPDDLRASAAIARETLSKLSDAEWNAVPPHMTWTRRDTAIHSISANNNYATQLASGIPAGVAGFRPDYQGIETAKIPELITSVAAVHARVAEASPPGTRGFHPAGSPDPEGFLGMGCIEILMHAWDAVDGTTVEIVAPDDLSERIVRRMFPWSSVDAPGWQALLFETGRGEISGLESPGDSWMWHNAPLDEWNGEVRRSERWKGR